jgi:hypothetical protein
MTACCHLISAAVRSSMSRGRLSWSAVVHLESVGGHDAVTRAVCAVCDSSAAAAAAAAAASQSHLPATQLHTRVACSS